jgi:hypothetical protein
MADSRRGFERRDRLGEVPAEAMADSRRGFERRNRAR